MKFVIRLYPRSKKIPENLVRRHVKFLEKLKKRRILLAAGYFEDVGGGMLILSESAREEAEAIVRKDPLIMEEAEAFQIWEWVQTF